MVDPEDASAEATKGRVDQGVDIQGAGAAEDGEVAEGGAGVGGGFAEVLAAFARGVVEEAADVFVVHREPDEEAVIFAEQIQEGVVEDAVGLVEDVEVFALGEDGADLVGFVRAAGAVEFQEPVHVIDRDAADALRLVGALDRAEQVGFVARGGVGAENGVEVEVDHGADAGVGQELAVRRVAVNAKGGDGAHGGALVVNEVDESAAVLARDDGVVKREVAVELFAQDVGERFSAGRLRLEHAGDGRERGAGIDETLDEIAAVALGEAAFAHAEEEFRPVG